MHEKLQHMKETLMCAVEMQLCDLSEVDTKELGEAIDMIKDLEEAIYYCTVTEAMKGNGPEKEWEMKKGDHHLEQDDNRMYYGEHKYPAMYNDSYMYADDGRRRRADGTFYADSGQSRGGNSSGGHGGGSSYADSMKYMNNEMKHGSDFEGRSYASRRMYMEAKHNDSDKSIQLRELEKYMQELSQDITEMISDASLEEKQYLEKKIAALASKIGQMK